MLRCPSRSLLLIPLLTCSAWAQAASPVIRYANIFGGSGFDTPTAVATDAAGNVYIAGQTISTDLPQAVRLGPSDPKLQDVFVAKIDPSGSRVLYSVIVGGGKPASIVPDNSGNLYVAGGTSADNFPTTQGAYATTGGCFLFKLNAAGNDLIYSTRLPCTSAAGTSPIPLAVDSSGNAYLAGSGLTAATAGAFNTTGFGPFAMKVNPQGTALLYATYLPQREDQAGIRPYAIVLDAQGDAYIAGAAPAESFATTVQPLAQASAAESGTATDVCVLELSADGSQLIFATLFGGAGNDAAKTIAVDSKGYIYVAGSTSPSDVSGGSSFPATPGVFDPVPGVLGFLTKLAPSGTAAVFSTFLPDTASANCLNITSAGIDILASGVASGLLQDLNVSRLLRVNSTGTQLLSSSIVSTGDGPVCSQQAGRFAVALERVEADRQIFKTNLLPLGPRGETDVWFSSMTADDPHAPQLRLDTGALELQNFAGPSGPFPPVLRTIHATSSGAAVPVSVSGYSSVSVTPSSETTSSDLAVSAPYGNYTDRIIVFAPGARDGLVIVPVSMTSQTIRLLVRGKLTLTAASPDSPPVISEVAISATGGYDQYRKPINFQLPFTVEVDETASSWLSVIPSSDTLPATLEITAEPWTLTAGNFYIGTVRVNTERGTMSFHMGLQVGTVPNRPTLTVTPDRINFQITDQQPSASQVVHLDSDGATIQFSVGDLDSWIRVTPASGVTPADVTVDVSSPGTSGLYDSLISFKVDSNASTGPGILLETAVKLPGYVGSINPQPMSTRGTPPPVFAPGSLVFLLVDPLTAAPTDAVEVQPNALTTSIGGYSFALNGIRVPLRGYQPGMFLAELPMGIAPGTHTLDEFDSLGTRIATTDITLGSSAPLFLEALSPDAMRARKADGSVVDQTHPISPRDPVLVRLTGQGPVQPAIPDGFTPAANSPSHPLAFMSATIGGKSAKVLSANMSSEEAGVLEVSLEVPDLADGDHSVIVHIGNSYTQPLPITVKNTSSGGGSSGGGGGGGGNASTIPLVNAASHADSLAPGTLFNLLGTKLATSTGHAAGVPLPTTLAGVGVKIGGKPAPLMYVSPQEIDGQVPADLQPSPQTAVEVSVNGVVAKTGMVPVLAAAPGIFVTGQNHAVAQNQDGSMNDNSHGAARASTVTVYFTGADISGRTPSVTVNGENAAVSASGPVPNAVGVSQIAFKIPDLAPGTYPLIVTIGTAQSMPAMITVK